MSNKVIYFLFGGTGSGKTTTANDMIENYGFKPVVSYTTRKPRDYFEPEYKFVSVKEFWEKEKSNVIKITDDWLYGVDPNSFQNNKLVYAVIDIQPIRDVIKYIKNNKLDFEIKIAHFDICKNKREKLAINRGENNDSMTLRKERELINKDEIINFDYKIIDFKESLNEFKSSLV